MTEIQKAMLWLVDGETGLSSKCLMATMLCGGKVGESYDARFHPHDPADFSRCVELLNAVPTFRSKLNLMKLVSKEWAVLVDHWNELEVLLKDDVSKNPHRATKTWGRMQELFKLLEPSND